MKRINPCFLSLLSTIVGYFLLIISIKGALSLKCYSCGNIMNDAQRITLSCHNSSIKGTPERPASELIQVDCKTNCADQARGWPSDKYSRSWIYRGCQDDVVDGKTLVGEAVGCHRSQECFGPCDRVYCICNTPLCNTRKLDEVVLSVAGQPSNFMPIPPLVLGSYVFFLLITFS
ncbi:uncharacterized protein LOC129589544 [Paramacrobiotus metropolitanus]|uniref:uncharacterized protein LOC129589544 n=1 Tax=Paramacrobiotus metropolitanus TaxID=2943436 RepID=UPI002445DC6C|nr:uncharacterized protein LOC129589544 [Paramacrobiotus metropolitanus]